MDEATGGPSSPGGRLELEQCVILCQQSMGTDPAVPLTSQSPRRWIGYGLRRDLIKINQLVLYSPRRGAHIWWTQDLAFAVADFPGRLDDRVPGSVSVD